MLSDGTRATASRPIAGTTSANKTFSSWDAVEPDHHAGGRTPILQLDRHRDDAGRRGQHINQTVATEAVTVNAGTAPTVAPVAESGVEGSAIALNLGLTVNGLTDDTNSLSSLMVSGIPDGAVLSDGTGLPGHSFTADATHGQQDVSTWTLSSLTITPATDANFARTVTSTSTQRDRNTNQTVGTENVTVNPRPPLGSAATVEAPDSGVEQSPITLHVTSALADNDGRDQQLSDGDGQRDTRWRGAERRHQGHSFTADRHPSANKTSAAWTLSGLTITPATDANFALTVTATSTDLDGNTNQTVATENVTVNPLQPLVTAATVEAPDSGVEQSPITLHLGTSALADNDGETLQTVISGIPDGAVLSDGTGLPGHSFTADATHGQQDVSTWTLSSLTITPATDANFALTVTATSTDLDGNTNQTVATENVTVTPTAPTVSPVAESGIEGNAIALDLGVAATGLSGDGNTLYSVTVSDIPANATLSDAHDNALTVTGGSITFDASEIAAGALNGLTLTPENAGPVTLNVSAVEQDLNGDLSTAQTGSESITVSPASNGAQTFSWNNPGGGDWDDAGNWTPSGPPGATDNVVIDTSSLTDPSSPLTITLSDPSVTIADLTISSGVKLDVGAGDQPCRQRHPDKMPATAISIRCTSPSTVRSTTPRRLRVQTDSLTIDGTMTGGFTNSGTIDAATGLTISASVADDFSVTGRLQANVIETYDHRRLLAFERRVDHHHRWRHQDRKFDRRRACRSRPAPLSTPAPTLTIGLTATD